MLFAKFCWNWPSGSIEEDFLNFVIVFSLFRNHLPLERGGTLHLNNLIYPWPKDDLCLVWLKLAQWFWRKRFVKIVNAFSHFPNYLPLVKGRSLSFEQTLIHFTHPRMFCAKFGWIGLVVLKKMIFQICQCIFAIS